MLRTIEKYLFRTEIALGIVFALMVTGSALAESYILYAPVVETTDTRFQTVPQPTATPVDEMSYRINYRTLMQDLHLNGFSCEFHGVNGDYQDGPIWCQNTYGEGRWIAISTKGSYTEAMASLEAMSALWDDPSAVRYLAECPDCDPGSVSIRNTLDNCTDTYYVRGNLFIWLTSTPRTDIEDADTEPMDNQRVMDELDKWLPGYALVVSGDIR